MDRSIRDSSDLLAQKLVRAYSNSLKMEHDNNPKDDTGRRKLEDAFVEETECEEALTALFQSPSPSSRVPPELQEEYDKLKATMEKFKSTFPDIAGGDVPLKSVSWASLHQTVSNLQTLHKKRSGKAKKGFHEVCATIGSHLTFLKLIPQGENYTAPICGSLELIVKASARYGQIGEDFATAMQEIDDIVGSVEREISLDQDHAIIKSSIVLSCRIIEFVAMPLRWLTQSSLKRVFTSFNENYSSEYQGQIDEIRRISEHIQRVSAFLSARRIKDMSRMEPELKRLVHITNSLHTKYYEEKEERTALAKQVGEQIERKLLDHQKEWKASFVTLADDFLRRIDPSVGVPIKQILDRGAQDFVEDKMVSERPNHNRPGIQPLSMSVDGSSSEDQPCETAYRTACEVKEASDALTKYFDFNQIVPEMADENILGYIRTARGIVWKHSSTADFALRSSSQQRKNAVPLILL
ncbi:uncharacterized protein EKO05_0005640 [Ascochyta rabiei]|uniref:uncharacterized protein n=1 Tax=Didymella rabiei TaxID=5454 RepID=UPI0021FE131D|nr:uncharacterized protein EKO05_0005640 [Ascochyta rabiei]UPX15183.1 hypothetical protein EKO05_0005640 [Ascochyta rabiei]